MKRIQQVCPCKIDGWKMIRLPFGNPPFFQVRGDLGHRCIRKLFRLDSETCIRKLSRWIRKLFRLDSKTFPVVFGNFCILATCIWKLSRWIRKLSHWIRKLPNWI